MDSLAWSEIENIYTLPNVLPSTVAQFRTLKSTQSSHTKGEGNLVHYCSFFLPYDKAKEMIYLGHHIKADDVIPPGGHIEPGESPIQAVIREMSEELRVEITPAQVEAWNLSVKEINRPQQGCQTHYDVWHLVHIPYQDFDFDQSEYYSASWYPVREGVTKITKNPDYAKIVSLLT